LEELHLAGNQFPNSFFENKALSRKIVYKRSKDYNI